ncbi:RHS repeat domain-containing protein [Flavobacterium microcysteis]|uniref:RHS repeat protein n=1 Tax=Flavobacterium microcysteis TaxID=2596891 RepID=A0A501QI63_9FLAO|nr:RHS repeat domain-containing protein [Flavobacterium microcysteis]TPD71807.1 hypothetical protein FJA49_02720 [Flavobacterium microcysteis]
MKKIYALLAIGLGMAAQAQELPATLEYGSGSLPKETSSMFKFDDVPVSLYTGVPDVSIPLLSLPTRSKDISIDMTYNYHPSGSGWNITHGGVITRVIENSSFEFRTNESGFANNTRISSDVYKFSFMGHSGSFVLKKQPDNTLVPSILFNKGQYIKIDVDYNPTTYFINSFTAYDTKGYKFVFGVYDKNITTIPGLSMTKETRTSFRLTAIYDNNGQKLAGITYTEKFQQDPGSSKKEYINITSIVESEGFGKAQFTYSPLYEGRKVDEITLSDLNTNVVKRIDFRDSEKLVFRDVAQAKNEEYRFYYSDGIYGNYDAERGLHRIDKFGYPNFIPFHLYEGSYMDEGAYITNSVNPNIITRGVLEKIGLPTGGSILYEYESNTYSYFQGTSISEFLIGNTFQEDPDFYYNYWDYETTFAYNHIVEEIKRGSMGMLSFFDVDGVGPQTIHISVRPRQYYSNLSLTWVYPPVNISGPGSSFPHYRPYNLENYGYGRGFVLNPGRHTIQVGNFTEQGDGADYIISRIRRNPDVKKWKYGGGRRIKKIAYFDTNAPADLFRKGPGFYPQEYVPVKETYYSYNLFNEPNRSSGNLVADSYEGFSDKYGQVEFVGYSNVTVTDSGNNGKTEYTFTSAFDYPNGLVGTGESQSSDYKRGLLKNRRDYDRNGAVVQSTNYEYIFFDENYQVSYFDNRTVVDRTGKSRLLAESTTSYPTNSTPISKITVYDYYNDINRNLESKTATSSAGEALKSKYYYHTGNSTLSKNRISIIEKVEDYRNGSLINTSKTDYSNNWPDNVSWLPSAVSASTGSTPLVTKARFNRYDKNSNLLENEQSNGTKTSYIWGYNNTQIVAKIENMAYASIPQSLIDEIKTATNSGTETTVLQKLDLLRSSPALAGAMLTTYTYRPLVGVTTVTDPKGDRVTYEYDSFGRPKAVKDKSGNTLAENQYNYRP